MSTWTLSLTDLANQAEAFLDQVDKKTAESLQEEDSPSYHGNYTSKYSKTLIYRGTWEKGKSRGKSRIAVNWGFTVLTSRYTSVFK